MRGRTNRFAAGAVLTTLVLTGAACSDDEPTTTTDTTAEAGDGDQTTTAGGETTDTTGGEASGATIEVTAVDYAFEGVPETMAAGDRFSLTADAAGEPHELVAILIPEGEDRSVEELVALPEEELDAIFGAGEPATVILAAPGQTDVPGPVVGDGSLTEPGRYALICGLPVGSTPELLETEGPPPEDAGPPHFSEGMYAEVTVE